MNRILAIDYGTVRIGIALSDSQQSFAIPLQFILMTGIIPLSEKLNKLIQEYQCQKLILGLPIALNGKETQKTKEVRNFRTQLKKYIKLPIHFHNEALTSYEAKFILNNRGIYNYKKRNKTKDSLSAQILLQDYLDLLKKEKIK